MSSGQRLRKNLKELLINRLSKHNIINVKLTKKYEPSNQDSRNNQNTSFDKNDH